MIRHTRVTEQKSRGFRVAVMDGTGLFLQRHNASMSIILTPCFPQNNFCRALYNIMEFPAHALADTQSRASTRMLQHRSDRLANTSPGEECENASSRRVVERLDTAFAAARTNTRNIDYTFYTTPYQGSPPNEHPEMILPPRSEKQFAANTASSFLVKRHKNCSLHQSAAKLKIYPYLILQNLCPVGGWP
jgi:hypothetical protein